MQRIIIFAVTILAVLLGAITAYGEELTEVTAAKQDACRKLANQIKDLRLDSKKKIKHLVLSSEEMHSDFIKYLQELTPAEVRNYNNGTAEVDLEIKVSDLIIKLKDMIATKECDDFFKNEQFSSILTEKGEDYIEVTGFGSQETFKEKGEKSNDFIMPHPLKRPKKKRAVCWDEVPKDEKVRAKRKARVQAHDNIIEYVLKLKVSDGKTVEKIFKKNQEDHKKKGSGEIDSYENMLRVFLNNSELSDVRYRDDKLVVECDIQIQRDMVISFLKEMAKKLIKDKDFDPEVFDSIFDEKTRKILRVTGSANVKTKKEKKNDK